MSWKIEETTEQKIAKLFFWLGQELSGNNEQSEQFVCPHCKGKGEYIDTHPERYGLKNCECQTK